jgi:hypothetical protein
MKVGFRILCAFLLALMSCTLVHANAQSEFDHCLERSSAIFQDCRANGGGFDGCNARYDRSSDSCQRRFDERVYAESQATQNDTNGRFVPIEIPQRETYILRGMR